MAAGVSLPVENVPAFTECFTGTLKRLYPDGLCRRRLFSFRLGLSWIS